MPPHHYNHPWRENLVSYVLGYAISIVFTLTAFALVEIHVLSNHGALAHSFLIAVVVILAIAQLFVQLFCFLHVGQEARPRWNLIVFLYAAFLVVILVIGTMWIMSNLNYNMGMSPQQMDTYMLDQ